MIPIEYGQSPTALVASSYGHCIQRKNVDTDFPFFWMTLIQVIWS